MKLEYRYSIVKDGDEEILDIPAFPEVVCLVLEEDRVQGRIEAIAADAIRNAIQARIDYTDSIPGADGSDAGPCDSVLQLSPLLVTKILLYLEFRKRGCTKSEFARIVRVTPTTLSRLFDLSHESRFDVVMHAFDGLGLEVVSNISVRRR